LASGGEPSSSEAPHSYASAQPITKNPDVHTGLPLGVKVAIGVGAALALLVTGVLAFWFRKRAWKPVCRRGRRKDSVVYDEKTVPIVRFVELSGLGKTMELPGDKQDMAVELP